MLSRVLSPALFSAGWTGCRLVTTVLCVIRVSYLPDCVTLCRLVTTVLCVICVSCLPDCVCMGLAPLRVLLGTLRVCCVVCISLVRYQWRQSLLVFQRGRTTIFLYSHLLRSLLSVNVCICDALPQKDNKVAEPDWLTSKFSICDFSMCALPRVLSIYTVTLNIENDLKMR